MTSSEFDEPVSQVPSRSENIFSTCGQPRETDRSMLVLARLAKTLGVPIEAFFEDHAGSMQPEANSADDLAELNRAFLAIVDPLVRRRCLDLVRAASAESLQVQTRSSEAD